ncbi:hypothetical protein LPJ53_000206 [Coemansia erecta]|uniref:Protein YOP1 n=1 Tax=Coemansia erecta TaxID=147472 RepID=A0A9W8CWB0_9FUNG|nr:hypothetical protein LPJ53_000206 [Coemansia erecta]
MSDEAPAAASTAYAMRYLYTHALDLLTNIVGVAYPAYQSVMAIEYGNSTSSAPADMSASAHMTEDVSIDGYKGQALEKALGIMQPNLDKKQWLMYWAIYGVLTTADHWAGPILRLFPMYRIAKIGVLVWAQHGKYNGAAWLYDTFVKPLLPPPTQQSQTQAQAQTQSTPVTMVLLSRKHADRRAEAYSGGSLTAVDEISDVDTCDAESDKQDDDSDYVVSQPFSALVMPSVWDRQSA